jgi:hypothetical protein
MECRIALFFLFKACNGEHSRLSPLGTQRPVNIVLANVRFLLPIAAVEFQIYEWQVMELSCYSVIVIAYLKAAPGASFSG